MTTSESLAEAYVQEFWAEKHEPMKRMLRMAYIAGTHDLRAQAAIAAMQGMITAAPKCKGYQSTARHAVNFADALIAELNNRRGNEYADHTTDIR